MNQGPSESIGRVLLIGADGMLGRCWESFLIAQGVEHDAVARRRQGTNQLDVTDRLAVDRCLARGYRWVINCSAYTAVDAAETEPLVARRINDEAVRDIAESAAAHGVKLVHYSTDYVFSGHASSPYPVNAEIAPINVYGQTKADGEKHVQSLAEAHLLLRTSWVYAPWGKNFVLTMRQLLRSLPEVKVVSDQLGRPTSVDTLVEVTWALMASRAHGTFHVTDGGQCSWFELAAQIAREIGASCVVRPCSSKEFPRPARRPAYSVLDLRGTEDLVGPLPHWQSALAKTLGRISD